MLSMTMAEMCALSLDDLRALDRKVKEERQTAVRKVLESVRRDSNLDILIVEDNPADARLVKEVFEGNRVPVNLHIVTTAEAGLDFLHGNPPYQQAPIPDIILVDWVLPGMSGAGFIQTLRRDEYFRHVPICVLTGHDPETLPVTPGTRILKKPLGAEQVFNLSETL